MRWLQFICLALVLFFYCQREPSISLGEPQYNCTWNGYDSLIFLNSITCPDEFNALGGPPLLQIFGNVKSVKAVYEISTGSLYYVSTAAYQLHFDFCKKVLNYKFSHSTFNNDQYGNGPGRLYYLATVNHYKSSNNFTMEFFADDKIDAAGLQILYSAIVHSSYFGNKLQFLPTSARLKQLSIELPNIPAIDENEIYGKQNFQALNPGQSFGWLRKVSISDIGSAYLGRHDILVVNGLPVEIPVISGIVTTVFQTPLSHVNVLSHNRGTPNMALKTAWVDDSISKYIDKLVFFSVTSDSFLIREASLSEADSFWRSREPDDTVILECHDDTAGLFDMMNLSHKSLNLVGAKAANFAELTKITIGPESLPVPEAAFAIPFFYYRKHLSENGIDSFIERMLTDSLFKIDYRRRISSLEKLRDSINNAPLDNQFVKDVEEKIQSIGNFKSMRFRSSTNVEDIEGFNGAGLYESHTAKIGDPEKSVEKTIKKVFASLWTMRGFEEREYFKIDHRSAAMGILVHRSFPDEDVNGVAITGNIYLPELTAYTVNAQINEISVVSPPQGVVADQFLFYLFSSDAFENPVIEYITKSSVNNGVPVMTNNEIAQLAKWLKMIERRFYSVLAPGISENMFDMDVEFKLDENRKLYIKQARPYSTKF